MMGRPVGTIKCWRARGRDRLRDRLIRSGLVPSVAAVMAADVARAAVPGPAAEQAVRAAVGVLSDGMGAGVVPAPVFLIVKGVMNSMFMRQIRTIGLGDLRHAPPRHRARGGRAGRRRRSESAGRRPPGGVARPDPAVATRCPGRGAGSAGRRNLADVAEGGDPDRAGQQHPFRPGDQPRGGRPARREVRSERDGHRRLADRRRSSVASRRRAAIPLRADGRGPIGRAAILVPRRGPRQPLGRGPGRRQGAGDPRPRAGRAEDRARHHRRRRRDSAAARAVQPRRGDPDLRRDHDRATAPQHPRPAGGGQPTDHPRHARHRGPPRSEVGRVPGGHAQESTGDRPGPGDGSHSRWAVERPRSGRRDVPPESGGRGPALAIIRFAAHDRAGG